MLRNKEASRITNNDVFSFSTYYCITSRLLIMFIVIRCSCSVFAQRGCSLLRINIHFELTVEGLLYSLLYGGCHYEITVVHILKIKGYIEYKYIHNVHSQSTKTRHSIA